jgi:hypothetical protein
MYVQLIRDVRTVEYDLFSSFPSHGFNLIRAYK